MTKTYRDWAEKLPFALWGHRTTTKTVNGASPYELVYGMEAVLPVDIERRALRIVVEAELPEKRIGHLVGVFFKEYLSASIYSLTSSVLTSPLPKGRVCPCFR